MKRGQGRYQLRVQFEHKIIILTTFRDYLQSAALFILKLSQQNDISGQTRLDGNRLPGLLQSREDHDEQFSSAGPQLFPTCKERYNIEHSATETDIIGTD